MSELRNESDYPHSALTQRVIGAAFEVHRELGPGFLEKVYETALVRELGQQGIQAEPQAIVPVYYKGSLVGSYYADILVGGSVICEIKAVKSLDGAHEAQLLHYLKATDLTVGLLLNFGRPSVQVKRLVLSH